MTMEQENNQSSKMVLSKRSSTINCTIFRYSSLLLFLAMTVVAAQTEELLIQVNNDQKYLEPFRSFELGKSFIMQCRVKDVKMAVQITWLKNSKPVQNSDRVQVNPSENHIAFHKPEQEDAGNYTCETIINSAQVSKTITLVAMPLAKMPKNTYVVENEMLTIKCETYGNVTDIVWEIGNLTLNSSEDRIKLSEDNHVLEISNITLNDRGNFTCIVNNDQLEVSFITATFVRVKGKYAALWPFLGICAEVFVLCTIILIYEKRRNKLQEAEESDTDSPELKNDIQEKYSDMRHRK